MDHAPSLELHKQLRRRRHHSAAGGPGMVKHASSGKPALGVGAGNTPVIIDDSRCKNGCASSNIHSKTFDNGMICASSDL